MLAGLSFAAPWLLAALAALPLIWWLIRALPPLPRQAPFPPIRLLAGLAKTDAPPQAAPWWLLLLRLVMAALVIAALAGPIWSPPQQTVAGEGPALILIDNGWAAAPGWPQRQQDADRLIGRLAAAGRPILLVPTAPPPGGWPPDAAARLLAPLAPAEAQAAVRAMAPHAWPSDPATIAAWLDANPPAPRHDSFWLSDGFGSPGHDVLIGRLRRHGTVHIVESGDGAASPAAFAQIGLDGPDFAIGLIRPPGQDAARFTIHATGAQGAVYGQADVQFRPGQIRADMRLTLPPPARQQVTQLRIQGQAHAGALFLLDDFSARPMVGITAVEAAAQTQPLNSARYYLERALQPYATLSHGPAAALADAGVSVIMMPDTGHLDPGTAQQLTAWIKAGGVLVRFAGPKLAAAQLDTATGDAADSLLPVTLRPGERAFGGAISWQREQRLARFAPGSPLGLLAVPTDVTVSRQVLAEPSAALESQSWALLDDGTPLITAAPMGQGHLVLFHVGANADWSNLVLSGSFVEILRHILPLGRMARSGRAAQETGGEDRLLTARRHVSGFGTLEPPHEILGAVPASRLEDGASAALPPGLYDAGSGISHAVNLAAATGPVTPEFRFTPLGALPADVRRTGAGAGPLAFAAPLFLAALALFLADMLASFWLRGLLPGRAAAMAIVVFAGLSDSRPAAALEEARAVELASAVRLACVESGSASADQTCLEGLRGLAAILRIRTAILAGEPVLVRADDDSLGFYPLLYWPVLANAPPLSARAAANVTAYLRQHGLILFDTGMGGGAAQATPAMQRLARRLDLAPWQPLSADHVLSHSFYILRGDSLGNGGIWIDAGTQGADGGVSSTIAGPGNWAAAWADAPAGAALGAPGRTQAAEQALRFGVNTVVYALTGTYKADQVHVPALLERMER